MASLHELKETTFSRSTIFLRLFVMHLLSINLASKHHIKTLNAPGINARIRTAPWNIKSSPEPLFWGVAWCVLIELELRIITFEV
jgi:hypothetical protein